jgi:hypothetical protein
MIILGKDTDDIGTQLERLTKRLLEKRDYRNVTTGIIGEGGNEIDVQAELPSRIPGGGSRARRLVAECKAWGTPIPLPEWLKFLGKVYSEESKIGNEVDGLYVALSGVNGAVRGNYDALRRRKQNIVLLEGEDLIAEVSELYQLSSAAAVASKLAQLSTRQYTQLELAYYREEIYWVFLFQDGELAVFKHNGQPLEHSKLDALGEMLKAKLQAKGVVDLAAEQRAKERRQQGLAFLISCLFQADGRLDLTAIAAENGFSIKELADAASTLEALKLVKPDASGVLSFGMGTKNDLAGWFRLFEIILNDQMTKYDWERLAGSKLFQSLLNEEFFEHVGLVQGQLPLAPEEQSKLQNIVRLSPSALRYIIRADPMIVNHRKEEAQDEQRMNADDVGILLRSALRCVNHDFRQASLKAYLFEHCNLREIELTEKFVIKQKDRILLEHESVQRVAIAELDESLGGGLIYIEAFGHAPQPWEWPGNSKAKG